ncbi:unnamed protein product, partial [Mesorhabditis belari]|uniref:Autophagy-related protein 101 n=1 Tax=Mesorhabditis belari TaxID=2138241 RepID=A0AAF3EYM0_9BILA
MNARHQKYRLNVDLRQVKDATSAFLHSLLLHRSVGKFTYKEENNYTLGSLGVGEVDCQTIDLTYVRINSEELCAYIDEQVRAFYSDVEESFTSHPPTPASSPSSPPSRFREFSPSFNASIGVEFLQKKKRQWPLSEESVSWEVWNLGLDIVKASNDELSVMRESVAEALGEIVLTICSQINRQQYMPKMPTRSELNSVFDSRFTDCQPYLYKIMQSTPNTRIQSQRPLVAFQNVLKNLAYPS